MTVFIGDDWAEAHHDVHLMGEDGEVVATRRLPEGLEGIGGFHDLVADHVEEPGEVVIGIETDRGLWVQALVATGYRVYAINPLAVSRYRDRHHLSGAKSDRGDAKVLADLVRTDRHNHRQVAGDTDLAEGVKVLARGHQNLIWVRNRHTNTLRSALREYYPAALEAFDDLGHPDALSVLGRAPTQGAGETLTRPQIKAALRRGGRQRNLDTRTEAIWSALRTNQLRAPGTVAKAFAATTKATVGILGELNHQIAELEKELAESFEQHPDTDIVRSVPGLGVILGARVLGEFGDDPNRYADAKSRRNYAGTSPITRASGKKRVVTARYIRNRRLYDAVDQWAFCSISQSAGCRDFYDERKAKGDRHHQALRALGNRLVGILHGCLKYRTQYDEDTAWAHRQTTAEQKAA